MRKRIVSLVLVFSILISLFPATVFAAPKNAVSVNWENPFSDVKKGTWYYDAVQYVSANGLISGVGDGTTFSPNDPTTRAVFVTALGRMAGIDAEDYAGKSVFSDVSPDAYYAPYVAWASQFGITGGTGDGKFSPDLAIDREQLAAFFVRYFETFSVKIDTGASGENQPADIDRVSAWAKESVLKMWEIGLLIGDGVNFNPHDIASRAQMASICYRADETVDTWYSEPGVPSERILLIPVEEEEESGKGGSSGSGGSKNYDTYKVSFYDGERLMGTMTTPTNTPLGQVLPSEKSSKPGAILLGYYTDPACTQPFYAEDDVTSDMNVYAKYQEMEAQEVLNFTSFAQMDQDPDISFDIRRVSGGISAAYAAKLVIKDGSAPVDLKITNNGDGTYTVAADGGFNEGCSYELNLEDGWVFVGKEESIRTAAFSIAMEEVENLQMSDDIIYIKDTNSINYVVDGNTYPVLTSGVLNENGGTFAYSGASDLEEGDILCIYVGVKPSERDVNDGSQLLDPAVYVVVDDVDGNVVTFSMLDEDAQNALYEVPDNFPILLTTALPTESTGTTNINDLDLIMYENMMGETDGTLSYAKSKINVGDFITLYLDGITSEDDLYFAKITAYNESTGEITYEKTTKQAIIDSMDLYANIDLDGDDLISDTEQQQLEALLLAQVQESDFAEEAAYLLVDMVAQTDGFRENMTVQEYLLSDENGNPLSEEEIELLDEGGGFELDEVDVSVKLITSGSKLHFNGGVQLAISIDAKFSLEVDDGEKIEIDLSASFVEEVMIKPKVNGNIVYKEILFIPVPVGVHVGASIDIKNYTALGFEAQVCTVSEEDEAAWNSFQDVIDSAVSVVGNSLIPAPLREDLKNVSDVIDKITELQNRYEQSTDSADRNSYWRTITDLWKVVESTGVTTEHEWGKLQKALDMTTISSEILGMMETAEDNGPGKRYDESLNALIEKYSEMIQQETDWVTIVDEEIFTVEMCVVGIAIGVETSFRVYLDMNIIIGSNLEYEVGKRYSFWFEIGLFKPTAGSSEMDLLDERFAFQFYVMGKIGVRAGVRAKLYVGIGSGDLASVGIAAELGPYIKLYGFFVYEYTRFRPKNTQDWKSNERMAGALYLEFGLYFILSFEAEALSLFEYTHDFLNEEVPLLTAGDSRYYYDCNYEPERDEIVYVRDENSDSRDGVTMQLPDEVRALSYVDLKSGRLGSESLPYDRYKITVSNRNFSITPNGKISVNVPDDQRFMECDLTITYLHGKLAFSDFDMTVTIPLVWTNLSVSELREYYTASVRVGNDKDGYDTVWTKKVLKSQPFDLPTEEEIYELIGWNDAIYEKGKGYGKKDITELTIVENTTYDFDIDFKEYSLKVEDVQKANGKTETRTYKAKYGETFDFSDLTTTGTDKDGTYTKFTNVTTEATITVNGVEQIVDLTKPINGKFAAALDDGMTATANYVDDSVTAYFVFSGIPYDDALEFKVRRGTSVNREQFEDVEAIVAAEKDMLIMNVTPEIANIVAGTNYTVVCGTLTGKREVIDFDENYGYGSDEGEAENSHIPRVDSIIKLENSFIGVMPTTERVGYDFIDWNYSQNKAEQEEKSNTFDTKEMPVGGITIYAEWDPIEYNVTFDINGGKKESLTETKRVVSYDSTYGYCYDEIKDGKNKYMAMGTYQPLPWPERENYGFAGWYCDFDQDGVLFEADELVTDETAVKITEDVTLVARWKTKVQIPSSVFSIAEKTVTYDGSGYKPEITFVGGTGTFYYLDDPDTVQYMDYPSEGYVIDYKRDGSDEYVRRTELPHVAGVYDVRIEREADNDFARMSWYNPYRGKLEIKKASSTLSGTLSVQTHGRAAIANFSTDSSIGDGALEYSVDGGSWTHSPVFYDLSSGSHTVRVRLGEGMNYKASSSADSESFSISSGSAANIRYEVVIKTEDKGSTGGTDADIYATVGDGTPKLLGKSGYNDFEQGAEDSYSIDVPADYDMSDGSITVNIRLDQAGEGTLDGWHWKMRWIQLKVYDGNTCIHTAEKLEGTEYDNDEESHDYTFTGVGRGIVDTSCGLRKSGNTIRINSTISDNYKTNYDPLAYPNAPRFVAYFGNSVFNKYIIREDLYTYYIDRSGLQAAMDEYRIEKITLHYGIDYASTGGVYGAADYMNSYTETISLPYKEN